MDVTRQYVFPCLCSDLGPSRVQGILLFRLEAYPVLAAPVLSLVSEFEIFFVHRWRFLHRSSQKDLRRSHLLKMSGANLHYTMT